MDNPDINITTLINTCQGVGIFVWKSQLTDHTNKSFDQCPRGCLRVEKPHNIALTAWNKFCKTVSLISLLGHCSKHLLQSASSHTLRRHNSYNKWKDESNRMRVPILILNRPLTLRHSHLLILLCLCSPRIKTCSNFPDSQQEFLLIIWHASCPLSSFDDALTVYESSLIPWFSSTLILVNPILK